MNTKFPILFFQKIKPPSPNSVISFVFVLFCKSVKKYLRKRHSKVGGDLVRDRIDEHSFLRAPGDAEVVQDVARGSSVPPRERDIALRQIRDVVLPVGQLDQERVGRHAIHLGDQILPFSVGRVDGGDRGLVGCYLGHEVHDVCPKLHFDLLQRRLGVFDRVVKESGDDDFVSGIYGGQAHRDRDGVGDVRNAPELPGGVSMLADRERDCFVEVHSFFLFFEVEFVSETFGKVADLAIFYCDVKKYHFF